MQILEIRVLRGPNYWSCYRKHLIQMKLDLGEYEHYPSNKLEGFCERLEELLPSLYDHECSEKEPGGFFKRVKDGTWLGHIAEHIALELQSLAGMYCGYGRTRSTKEPGVYHVVFSYRVETAGVYAAHAAVRIVKALAENISYDVSNDTRELQMINNHEGLGPSTEAIVKEAIKRGIPVRRLDKESLIMLGQGKYQQIIRSTVAATTSSVSVELAAHKEETKTILTREFIPVPKGKIITDVKEMDDVIKEIGFPLVVKPVNGNHGRGVTTNINTKEDTIKAFELASKISNQVIIEKFIEGADHRFLVINYKLVAVAKRLPAMVTGDGSSTIEQLIQQANEDPRRGEDHEKVLTIIKVDEATKEILKRNKLDPDSILPYGQTLILKDTANISTGGTSQDVTHLVHPDNVFLAERIARLMGLNICGIDIIARDVSQPITKDNGAVLEVNAGPGLRMHLAPSQGMPQNVAEPIVDMLFPKDTPSRIPVVGVTGTNGKTTTTRLIAHIVKQAGYKVGYTTTDGIYINGNRVDQGDCSGPSSAETVLRDPIVDFAVLECARGGILRSGLGFDKCNTSIITNITGDHLGLDGIDTLEELATVKAVLANSTFDNGYAILNADDDLTYRVRKELDCNIALFSTESTNERIKLHCERGGLAIVVEKGYFTVYKGDWGKRIARVKDVPLTLGGRAACMIQNLLPAILTAVIHDIDTRIIREAIMGFMPTPEMSRGRMNIFKFRNYEVMLDYAHNRDGYNMLKKFLDQTDSSEKIGIITSPGDRRDEDIRNAGMNAAKMFDRIIIRHDRDSRGRSYEEITRLIKEGIESVRTDIPVFVVSDEVESIQYAMAIACNNAFIVVCSEDVDRSLAFLVKAKEDEAELMEVK